MATGKQTAKQPGDDPGLKGAVKREVKEAQEDARTGDVATAREPADTVERNGHDRRPE